MRNRVQGGVEARLREACSASCKPSLLPSCTSCGTFGADAELAVVQGDNLIVQRDDGRT